MALDITNAQTAMAQGNLQMTNPTETQSNLDSTVPSDGQKVITDEQRAEFVAVELLESLPRAFKELLQEQPWTAMGDMLEAMRERGFNLDIYVQGNRPDMSPGVWVEFLKPDTMHKGKAECDAERLPLATLRACYEALKGERE